MCNLYSLTQSPTRQSATGSRTGNLPMFPGIFPTRWLQSFATEQTASVIMSWLAEAHAGRLNMEACGELQSRASVGCSASHHEAQRNRPAYPPEFMPAI
jgi:hypothetical protein